MFNGPYSKTGVLYDLSAYGTTCNAKLAPATGELVTVGNCVHVDDVIAAFPDRSTATCQAAPTNT